jgi:hypothetical protein
MRGLSTKIDLKDRLRRQLHRIRPGEEKANASHLKTLLGSPMARIAIVSSNSIQ